MPKSVSPKKSGLPKIVIALVIIVLTLAGLGGGYLLFSKTGILTKQIASLPKITKPSSDMSRARILTIYPDKENVMQVMTREKVVITLTIPKGAIDKKQNIKMIPYYYNEKSEDPSAGVIISPGNLSFKIPVTLMFDLSDSTLRSDAPKSVGKMETVRVTGTSQVLMIDQNASELIPTLVAREVETSTQLRARVLTGGGYVFSVNGKDQKRWAENAMQKDKVNSISILEASKVLLSAGVDINKKDRSKANAAADKILGKKLPLSHEMVAALMVKKLLSDKKTGFNLIPKASAQEGYIPAASSTPHQVIELLCKSKGLKVEEYVGFGAAAASYGYGDLRDKCMTVALNKAASDARSLLKSKDASIKAMANAIKNLQFLGLDEQTDLVEQLHEKIKATAISEANKVAYDIDATPIEMAKELQKLETLGAQGKTADILTERLVDVLEEQEANMPTPVPENYEGETDFSIEQVLVDQMWTVVGIEVLKAMGITDFSEDGLKDKFKDMTDNALLLNDVMFEMCKEMNGDNCDTTYNEAKNGLEDNLNEGYRVAGEIGTVQNSEYEAPDYDDSHGGFYFEEDLTPTPGEGDSEEWNYEDPADEIEDNHDQGEYIEQEESLDVMQSQSIDGEEEAEEEVSQEDEDVEGASTTNLFNVIIHNIKELFTR